MTIARDAGVAMEQQPRRLRFDRYVLDLDRGCLLLDEAEISLRPKTFATLHYLVANSRRLVSKDELFATVWPNVAVTDDALVQSIGELRRALGDDGVRLIKTIPRRGYRLDADVLAAEAADHSVVPPVAAGGLRSPERVGRTPLALLVLAAIVGVLLAIVNALWSGIGTGPTRPQPPINRSSASPRRQSPRSRSCRS